MTVLQRQYTIATQDYVVALQNLNAVLRPMGMHVLMTPAVKL
jgi:hypothetical protein